MTDRNDITYLTSLAIAVRVTYGRFYEGCGEGV